MKMVYTLEGQKIDTLQKFFNEFADMVKAPNGYFGNDLQQFDDCLFHESFGLITPCRIEWINSAFSQKYLDQEMLISYYEKEISICEKVREQDTMWYDDIIKNCKDIVQNIRLNDESMFTEIVSFIQSVSQRSSGRRHINLVLK